VGQPQGEGLDPVEEEGEEQGPDADAGFDDAVAGQEARWMSLGCAAFHEALGDAPEEQIPVGEAAEEDAKYGGGGFAMGAEEGGEVLLPGDLVDEAAEAGQHRQRKRNSPNHLSPHSPAFERERPARVRVPHLADGPVSRPGSRVTRYVENLDWMRPIASSTFSRELKADKRKNPSPEGPKPEPGVPTTLHRSSIASKKSHEERPPCVLSQM